jgi:hypothetical protein
MVVPALGVAARAHVRVDIMPAEKMPHSSTDDREQQTQGQASDVDYHKGLVRFISLMLVPHGKSKQARNREPWPSSASVLLRRFGPDCFI